MVGCFHKSPTFLTEFGFYEREMRPLGKKQSPTEALGYDVSTRLVSEHFSHNGWVFAKLTRDSSG
jgi:hypothetical protein